MKLKIKRLTENAVVPRYATAGSACFDLHASEGWTVIKHCAVGTGLVFEMPENHVGLIFPRSGNAAKHGVTLSNAVAVIDSDFRGEVKILIHNTSPCGFTINPGDRIAQMMIIPIPKVEIEEVDELSATARGTGGFGSTGVRRVERFGKDDATGHHFASVNGALYRSIDGKITWGPIAEPGKWWTQLDSQGVRHIAWEEKGVDLRAVRYKEAA